ncbi:hypothetical protein L873DRAFT_968915 [Choiromyces venosus 120613-1]|uniref:Uncharacterized protein n=1 Tax=Choiromyces venosus 120613-1 TaxID=1336337 RepID=A0A3N4K4N7_9PEZI|nr:hypothetical protein L873DRAFT_968915 [Choiromyces venosus 120613-1]
MYLFLIFLPHLLNSFFSLTSLAIFSNLVLKFLQISVKYITTILVFSLSLLLFLLLSSFLLLLCYSISNNLCTNHTSLPVSILCSKTYFPCFHFFYILSVIRGTTIIEYYSFMSTILYCIFPHTLPKLAENIYCPVFIRG